MGDAAELRPDAPPGPATSSDAELRALYTALPVGVAFLSPELRYQRVNATLAALNRRPVEEHLGRTIEEVLGERAAEIRPLLEEVVETRESREFSVVLRPPGGDDQPLLALEAAYFPVVGEDGRLIGVGGVVHDVTERSAWEVEQSRLLREAVTARAQAEAAQVYADQAREEAEDARAGAEIARAEAERGRARLGLLARAGRRMAESMDWEDVLRAVVRSAVPELADWSALTVVEGDGRHRIVGVAHTDPVLERFAWDLVERYGTDPRLSTPTAGVIRRGETAVASDITPEALRRAARDDEQFELMRRLGTRHSAIVPLKTSNGVPGALAFIRGDDGSAFSAEDLDLMTSLAARAALALESARLYTERSHIARTLQAGLRPRALATIPGAQVGARFLAAGDQNEVGGDFYDVFSSRDRTWTAFIGDVSGKGAEAASVTALARHTLRTAALLGQEPGPCLALLNGVLQEASPEMDFCTVVHLQIRPQPGGLELRLSNGGHPPPLLLRTDGTVEAIDAGRGPLVGGLPDAVFREATLHLADGELLLLYTDGVTEVRTSDVELGERELARVLGEHAGATPQAVVDAVLSNTADLQPGPPRDDIALLAIRATPSE